MIKRHSTYIYCCILKYIKQEVLVTVKMIEVLLTLLLVLILPFIIYKFYQHVKRIREILLLPGPKRHPILGNCSELMVDEVTLFKTTRKWGREFRTSYLLMIYPEYSLNVVDPKDTEKIISSMKHSKKSMFYSFLHKWLGEGLLTSAGNKWQTRRKLLTPAFHFTILQKFLGIFEKETKRLLGKLDEVADAKEVNLVPLISQFTLNSINETSMGTVLNEDDVADKEYKKALNDIGKSFSRRICRPWLYNNFIFYNFTSYGRRENKLIKILHKFTTGVIMTLKNKKKLESMSDSYAKNKRSAMLDLLLNAENEGLIDLNGINEEINTFMFEGHDTTAVSICYTLMLLSLNRDTQEEILKEINEVLPDPNEEPTISKLNDLKFLERCIKESLRLYPSVPFMSRVLDEDFTTSHNVTIPKGSIANIHIYDLHRNPDIYPNPDEFDPDRFLPENVNNRHPFAYIPFSAGPRNCIGQKFAILELKIVLVGIIRRFILQPFDTPETLSLINDMVIRSVNGVRIKFYRRK